MFTACVQACDRHNTRLEQYYITHVTPLPSKSEFVFKLFINNFHKTLFFSRKQLHLLSMKKGDLMAFNVLSLRSFTIAAHSFTPVPPKLSTVNSQ